MSYGGRLAEPNEAIVIEEEDASFRFFASAKPGKSKIISLHNMFDGMCCIRQILISIFSKSFL